MKTKQLEFDFMKPELPQSGGPLSDPDNSHRAWREAMESGGPSLQDIKGLEWVDYVEEQEEIDGQLNAPCNADPELERSSITMLFKGDYVQADLVDETIELTIADSDHHDRVDVYCMSEAEDILQELKAAVRLCRRARRYGRVKTCNSDGSALMNPFCNDQQSPE